MKLVIRITESEHGGYVASCPSLPGCVTRGQTREQARESIDDVIRGYLASVSDFVPEHLTDELVLEA